jgi:hypothetical protein
METQITEEILRYRDFIKTQVIISDSTMIIVLFCADYDDIAEDASQQSISGISILNFWLFLISSG